MNPFDLEKKKDGHYRCKGGILADILFIIGAIFWILGMIVVEDYRMLRDWIKRKNARK